MPERRVVQWLRDGLLAGTQVGATWEIAEADVTRVAATLDRALAPLAPELEAAELLIAAAGAVDGRAIREAVGYAREIAALADDWERRAEGGAAGTVNAELRDSIAERMRVIATLHAVLRGTAITYREVRDRLAGLAQVIEHGNEPTAPVAGEE
jgi:hypothetical protein